MCLDLLVGTRAFSERCANSQPFLILRATVRGTAEGAVLALSIGIVIMGKAYHIFRFPETVFSPAVGSTRYVRFR